MYQNFDFLFVEITIFQFLEEKIVETYQNWGVPVQYSSLSTLKNPQTIKKKVEMYPNLVFKGKNWTKFWFSASRGQHFPVSKGKIIEMYQNAGVPVQYSSLPTVKKKTLRKDQRSIWYRQWAAALWKWWNWSPWICEECAASWAPGRRRGAAEDRAPPAAPAAVPFRCRRSPNRRRRRRRCRRPAAARGDRPPGSAARALLQQHRLRCFHYRHLFIIIQIGNYYRDIHSIMFYSVISRAVFFLFV